VTTGSASDVSYSGATLAASWSGVNVGTAPQAAYFAYGTSENALTSTAYYGGSIATASGNYTASLTSLSPGTTYWYKAVMEVWDGSQYVDIEGSVRSFTTAPAGSLDPAGWLELPEATGDEDFCGRFYGSGGSTGPYRNYSYGYSYTYYASLWVAYPLTYAHTQGDASTGSWQYNPNVSSDYQVNIVSSSYPSMYGASAYSRGHQIPNASRVSDDTMNLQTYYSTNQTPQLQQKFNGSIWSSLENAVRNLTTTDHSDTVYVATGPVYRTDGGSETITYLTGAAGKDANPTSLPVPNYFWKALLKVKWSEGAIVDALAVGFWFPHEEYENSDTYTNYVVSVDQIETLTGIDLFTNLPASKETAAEANTSWTDFQSF